MQWIIPISISIAQIAQCSSKDHLPIADCQLPTCGPSYIVDLTSYIEPRRSFI
jgi:hypothetical protein